MDVTLLPIDLRWNTFRQVLHVVLVMKQPVVERIVVGIAQYLFLVLFLLLLLSLLLFAITSEHNSTL